MEGTLLGEGFISKSLSFRKTALAARPCVTNQGGVGVERKGARITVFCGRSNMSVLWTTPVPDWISVNWWPGNAPQVVVPSTKPEAAQ